jgi:hypothetical protein
MRLTKNQMARVIVQALYAMPALPAEDHPEVVKRAARGNVEMLKRQHKMAVEAILSTLRAA